MSRRKTNSRSNSKLEIEKAPLIITIVPQCSQKSTILKEISDDDINEISVDDVPQSFEKVPIGVALSQMDCADSAFITSEITEASAAYSDRNTYGISVFSRIAALKDTEQGLLLQVFTRSITFDAAESALRASVAEVGIEALLGAIKDLLAQKSLMTSSSVDIYIPQANSYSVQTAKTTLRDAAKNSDNVIVWSNINSSIDHYSDALAIAMQNKRPVRFIRWGLEVPAISFEQLVLDNISTFLATGRYATVASIRSSLDKVLSLIDIDNDYTHERLAYIAGFSMDTNGLLKKINPSIAYVKGPETAVYDGKLKAWFQNPQANMTVRKVVVKEDVEAVSPVSEESESAPLYTSQSHSSSDVAPVVAVAVAGGGDSDSDSGVKNPIVLSTTTTAPPSSSEIVVSTAPVTTTDAAQLGTPVKVDEARKGVAVVTPTSQSPPSVVSVPSVSPDRLDVKGDVVAAKIGDVVTVSSLPAAAPDQSTPVRATESVSVNDAHVEPSVTDKMVGESHASGDEKKEADVAEEGGALSDEANTKKSAKDISKAEVRIGDTIIADQNSKRHCCFSFFGFYL